MIPRVKGTQDFLDLTLFNFIIEKARAQLALYHFTEIATPILEHTQLFKRSLGLETDVVSKEMFTLSTNEERDALCLRPEATASVVRAFIDGNINQTPWKVFTWGPMFRHERPQKGRFRQFHQISMEVIGSKSIAQDAQFIKMLDRFFHEWLQINSYAVLINFLGCSKDRAIYDVKLKQFLDALGSQICETCLVRKEKNIMRVFDCKNPTCGQLYEKAPHICDKLCAECTQEWQELQDQLELLSVSFTHKPSLVRGLDYYNKTVFEFVSNQLGAQSAFCAGGRYDSLVSQLGGKVDQPSIGAALGIERLMLILDLNREKLALPQPSALHVIMPLGKQQQTLALLLADVLQANNLETEVMLEGDSLKSMMRHANKMGAAYCLLIGEDEQAKNEVMVKNMLNGTEQRMAQVDVVGFFKK